MGSLSSSVSSVSDDQDNLEALNPTKIFLGGAYLARPFLPVAQRYTDMLRVFRVSNVFFPYMIRTIWNKENLPELNVRNKLNKKVCES